MMRVLDLVKRTAKDDLAPIDQRDAIGHTLDLVEQMR